MSIEAAYSEDYFERGVAKGISGYTDYRWLPERTIPMVAHMCERLGIRTGDNVLDFGCAKGFVVLAMKLLYRQAWGVDVSKYAIDNAHQKVADRCTLIEPKGEIPVMCGRPTYDWCIAKDTLEHVPHEDMDAVLQTIRDACNKAYVVVPLGENGSYVVPSYEHDATHVIREDLDWWVEKVKGAGFDVLDYSHDARFVKENYASWERGNGFLELRVSAE